MKTALAKLRSLLKRAPVTGILTFVFISFFFVMAVPAQVKGASTAVANSPAVYTYEAGDAGAGGSGFVNISLLAVANEIIPGDGVPVSSTSSTNSTTTTNSSTVNLKFAPRVTQNFLQHHLSLPQRIAQICIRCIIAKHRIVETCGHSET